MNQFHLRLLHFSDLHLGKAGPALAWRARRVLGDAWLRNLDEIRDEGNPIDLVCFTGDVAQSAQSDQYAKATEFFDATLEHLGVGCERFFAVPGNHDVDRRVQKDKWEELRRAWGPDDARTLSDWLSGGQPPRGIDGGLREAIFERQAAFWQWLGTEFGRSELLPAASPHGRLGYRHTWQPDDWPAPVSVIGLDTVWLCGDDHDAGKLWLTDGQLMRLASNDLGDPLAGFRLVLMHHPYTELADRTMAGRLLAERVDLVLRGHLHEPECLRWDDPQRQLREVAAGCLYEHDRYPNSMQVIDIWLDAALRPQHYRIWFRSWSARGHWYSDDGLYRGIDRGRLDVWIQPPVEDPPAGVRVLPVRDRFFGRDRELNEIASALLSADRSTRPVLVCAVHGMPGIGKTYLVERFIHLHGEHFPGGVLRLGLSEQFRGSGESLRDELLDRLRQSGPPGQRWQLLRQQLTVEPRLLLVENVDDEARGRAVAELAVQLDGCPLLVTGRYRDLGAAGRWARVSVPEFTPDEARQLLSAELGDRRFPEYQLEELARQLGYLPLALHLAAGYLRTGYSIQGFLDRLRQTRLNLPPRAPDDHTRWSLEARAVLQTSFELSLKALRGQLAQEAGWLPEVQGAAGEWPQRLFDGFLALGHVPPEGVGRSLAAAIAGLDASGWETLAVAARSLSLLTCSADPSPRYSLHPLLAEWLRARSAPSAVVERMTDWFLARLPERSSEEQDRQGRDWQEVQQETPALLAWLPVVPEPQLARVVRAGSWYAMHCGPFAAWQTYCERSLAVIEVPAVRSELLWTLGNVARRAGNLSRARSAAEEIQAAARAWGAEREAALAAGLRADILQQRGETDEALRIRREEQLPVYQRLGDVRAVALTMGQIADLLQQRGETDEALRIRREEELPVYQRLGDVRERAVTIGKISNILWQRGETDEGLRILREDVLPVFERVGDVPSRAVAMGVIADILQQRGETDEALRIRREEELPIFEELGDVRERAKTIGKIADILQLRGETDEALRVLGEDVRPCFERLGDVHAVAVTMGKIADILQQRGETDESLRIRREEELPVYQRLGDVRAVAATRGNMADILQQRGETDEALRIRREEELPVYEKLGDVRAVAITRGKIADILQQRGETDEALRIRREEQLPVFERLGDIHSVAGTRAQIAEILQQQGETDEALRIINEDVLPLFEKVGDVRSRSVAKGKIADILQQRGETDEALRIRREEELPVYRRLGDVYAMAITMGKIADILQQRGETDEALRIRREEVLPVFERLGDMRNLLLGRKNVASYLLSRGAAGDREEAAELLRQAREAAEGLRLPEAEEIRLWQVDHGFLPR